LTIKYSLDEYSCNEYATGEYKSQHTFIAMSGRSTIDLTAIGARIKKLRGLMLQEELAVYLDLSQGHLSKIEGGKIAPSLEILMLLSAKFHKSVDWILRGEGD
jgi:DNA-binding XRE family transcriptional regulator